MAKLHDKIIFAFLIAVGTGLCIGGIFVTALLIPGAGILAGAMGMYAKIFAQVPEPVVTSDILVGAAENPRFKTVLSIKHHESFTNTSGDHISNDTQATQEIIETMPPPRPRKPSLTLD